MKWNTKRILGTFGFLALGMTIIVVSGLDEHFAYGAAVGSGVLHIINAFKIYASKP